MTIRVRADEVVGAGIGREIPAGREFQATVEPHERASRDARHEGNNQDHSMDRSHEPSHRSTMPCHQTMRKLVTNPSLVPWPTQAWVYPYRTSQRGTGLRPVFERGNGVAAVRRAPTSSSRPTSGSNVP